MGKSISYFLFVLLSIGIGLASRHTNAFSDQITVHLGDVCWAMMVYFLCRLLFSQISIFTSALLSFIFSFGIEFSQLYQSDWINILRNTLIGGLILGRGFLWIDLLRYSIGVLLGVSIDKVLSRFIPH